jgi:MFS family permease
MSDAAAERADGTFFGWRLVGALGVILFFTGGGGLYVFPVFIESFQAEFGWSMTEISAGAAVFAIVMGLSGPLIGVLIARLGARTTMLIAACLFAATTLAYAGLRNLTMLYLLMIVTGFGVAGTTILPTQTPVTNGFDVYRGRALGLAMLGIGFGGFLLPPLNEFVIRLVGWRATWAISAGVTAGIVIPAIALFVRTHPSELGLKRDGAPNAAAGSDADSAHLVGLPVQRALRTPTFWLLVCIFVAQLTGLSALNFHFVPFAIKQGGFTSQEAAFYYGLTVGFSIAGRLLFGWLVDRWSPKLLVACAGLLLALGPAVVELLIVRLGLQQAWLLTLYAIPFGIGIGGHAITLPVLTGRCFGELHFSKIMGLVLSGFAVGVIVGIPLAGRIFDTTGSYELVLIGSCVMLLLSMILAALIQPERYHAEFESEGA